MPIANTVGATVPLTKTTTQVETKGYVNGHS